jgi:hypothetical protein
MNSISAEPSDARELAGARKTRVEPLTFVKINKSPVLGSTIKASAS